MQRLKNPNDKIQMTSKNSKISFQEKVYKVVAGIPRGKVLSYAEVARLADSPRASRAVGTLMHRNPHKHVPCHRVICSGGRVGNYARGPNKKIQLLRKEGVGISGGRINFKL